MTYSGQYAIKPNETKLNFFFHSSCGVYNSSFFKFFHKVGIFKVREKMMV